MSMFLTPEEVAELTGIKRGRDGKTRDQLQAEHLRSMAIPFYPNASGRPIVAKAIIEGGIQTQLKKSGWQSNVLSH